MLFMVLAAVALGSALTAMRYAIHGREVLVPDLVGLAPAAAEERAAEHGLGFYLEERFYSADIPEGRVMSQLPAAGASVRRGWRVRVAESLGPQRVTIPNVMGQSSRAAEINLRRRGLELGRVARAYIPELPPGQVAAQSPGPEATEVRSPRVDLLITAPPPETAYVMPEFVGHPLADAARRVRDSGLRLGSIEPAPEVVVSSIGEAEAAPAGAHSPAAVSLVLRQTPPAGSKVMPGAVVIFEVSR